MNKRHLTSVPTGLRPVLSPPNPNTRAQLKLVDGGLPHLGSAAVRTTFTEADMGEIFMDLTPIDQSLSAQVHYGIFSESDLVWTTESLIGNAQKITKEFERKRLPIDRNAARLREASMLLGDVLGQGIGLGEYIDSTCFRTSPLGVCGEDVARAVVTHDTLSWLAASIARGADTAQPKELGGFLDAYPSEYWSTKGVADRAKVDSYFQCLAHGMTMLFDDAQRQEIVRQLDDARAMVIDVTNLSYEEYGTPEAVKRAWDIYLHTPSEVPPAS